MRRSEGVRGQRSPPSDAPAVIAAHGQRAAGAVSVRQPTLTERRLSMKESDVNRALHIAPHCSASMGLSVAADAAPPGQRCCGGGAARLRSGASGISSRRFGGGLARFGAGGGASGLAAATAARAGARRAACAPALPPRGGGGGAAASLTLPPQLRSLRLRPCSAPTERGLAAPPSSPRAPAPVAGPRSRGLGRTRFATPTGDALMASGMSAESLLRGLRPCFAVNARSHAYRRAETAVRGAPEQALQQFWRSGERVP